MLHKEPHRTRQHLPVITHHSGTHHDSTRPLLARRFRRKLDSIATAVEAAKHPNRKRPRRIFSNELEEYTREHKANESVSHACARMQTARKLLQQQRRLPTKSDVVGAREALNKKVKSENNKQLLLGLGHKDQ